MYIKNNPLFLQIEKALVAIEKPTKKTTKKVKDGLLRCNMPLITL